jgi:FkbM family methyltransferase
MIYVPDLKADKTFSLRLDRLFFQGKNEGTLIECGANDGLTRTIGMYFEQRGWQAINIEPHPDAFKQLVVNRPGSVNLNLALSDKVGKAQISWPTNRTTGVSTLEKYRGKRACSSATVSTTTYKNVIEVLGVQKIDLFILDVEEHELSVIRGMEGSPVWPEYFIIETNKPTTTPEIVGAALAPKGYTVVGSGGQQRCDKNNTYFWKRDGQ